MLRVVYQQHPLLCKWAGDILDREFDDKCKTIAIENNGKIIAVILYYNYTGDDVEMAIASRSPKWITRKILRIGFRYPFCQLGCSRVTGRVEADDHKVLEIDKRLGFVVEGTVRKALKGKDIIILGMLKDECRWIHGKEKYAKSP